MPTRCVAESRTIGALDLTTADRGALLRLARGALEAYLAGGDPPALPEGDAVRQKCGAFVTLAAAGALRGCVGHVPADRPLARVVRDMVVAAGRDDARFPPVAASELGTLRGCGRAGDELVGVGEPEPEGAGFGARRSGGTGMLGVGSGRRPDSFAPLFVARTAAY